MTQPQPVVGFFDNLAEAQQAVQLLLTDGFTPESLNLTTQTDNLVEPDSNKAISPTDVRTTRETDDTYEATSGHFLFSLFGRVDETQPAPNPAHTAHRKTFRKAGAFITVRVQSAAEAERATNLLKHAGASIY